MSLLNDASLVMIPSGYKDTKLYSVKPTNGDGDFTFSRGSNLAATRVNSEGLIEKGRENLLLQSNSFDTTWSLVNASVTSGQSGYDGSSDAWLLTKTSGTGSTASVRQTISLSGSQTFSVYAKAGSLDWMALIVIGGSNPQAYFNVSNGTLGSTGNGAISSFITDAGNGWYRCSIVLNESVTQLRIYTANDDNVANGAAGNILIQDAQLEQGLVATDYIETTTTTAQAGILEDMPRLDYSGGASCPSLLLEPQRSNLVTYSEYFGGYGQINTSVITNETTSLEGLQNATLVSATGTGQHYIQSAAITYTSSTTYTYSVFAKKSNTSLIQLLAPSGPFGTNAFASYNFDTLEVTEGSSATASMEDYGNGWYRLILTCTSTGSALVSSFYLVFTDDKSVRVPSFTSSGEEVYCYGAMLEEASYPTSYIPTYGGSSVTRSQDSCSKTGISSLIGQTEGTLFVDFNWEQKSGVFFLNSISDGTVANEIMMAFGSTADNRLRFSIVNNSIGSVSFDSATLSSGRYKIAFAYANNDAVAYINGVEQFADSSVVVPATSAFKFLRANDTLGFNGTINQQLLFKTRLSNDELASLTTI